MGIESADSNRGSDQENTEKERIEDAGILKSYLENREDTIQGVQNALKLWQSAKIKYETDSTVDVLGAEETYKSLRDGLNDIEEHLNLRKTSFAEPLAE